MSKLKNYVAWGSLFLLISCSNFSNLCRHTISRESEFGFRNIETTTRYSNKNAIYAAYETTQFNPVNPNAFPLTWDMLADVKYKLKWNAEYQLDFNYPVFGKNIKKYKGKEVDVAGYMIPIDINAGLYVISRYNYASCFFCGGGGPESIVTLKFKTKPKRYKTDAYLTMKGTLELNDTNVNEYFYIFRDAEEVK